MSFLKSVLSTVLGLFVFLLIIIPLCFVLIVSVNENEVPIIENSSLMYIKLSGTLVERVVDDPLKEILRGDTDNKIALLQTLEAIKVAKSDDNIEGIYLEHGYLRGGYASMNEIRLALEDFKSSGKFIYSYGEFMTEASYYIASVADEIILNPIGILEFNGLSANVTFFKGLFDKLDIEAQIFRVGTYKSAVEPYFRKNMSTANKEQVSSFINDIFNHYLANVSTSRGIELNKLRDISNKMLVRNPEDALNYGLITKIGYENEVKDQIKTQMSLEKEDKIKFVSIKNYIRTLDSGYSAQKIAVIVAEGDIVSGTGETGNIGSDRFVKAIKAARKSKRVKAVVIRVNSPGGSVLASDVLWNEIMLTKKEKPVIASMSAVAASGGYYLSMPCDTIVAQPMTITGSIGIFGVIPNLGNFLENKLGITSDGVSTGEFSNLYRVSSALNEHEKNIIQAAVERGYETFTAKVAEGRNMSIGDIKNIASGRVWTGTQAKERGLVDVLGTYDDAVLLAAQAAGIENDYVVAYYPKMKSSLEELFSSLVKACESRISHPTYGYLSAEIKKIKALENFKGIQARMPFEIEIK